MRESLLSGGGRAATSAARPGTADVLIVSRCCRLLRALSGVLSRIMAASGGPVVHSVRFGPESLFAIAYLTHLNFAVCLANDGQLDGARDHYRTYEALLKDMGPDEEHEDGLLEHAKALRDRL